MGIYGGTSSPAPADARADCHNAGHVVEMGRVSARSMTREAREIHKGRGL